MYSQNDDDYSSKFWVASLGLMAAFTFVVCYNAFLTLVSVSNMYSYFSLLPCVFWIIGLILFFQKKKTGYKFTIAVSLIGAALALLTIIISIYFYFSLANLETQNAVFGTFIVSMLYYALFAFFFLILVRLIERSGPLFKHDLNKGRKVFAIEKQM